MSNQPDLNSILSVPPGVLILSSEICPSQNRITLDVEFEPEDQVCPRCGSHHCIVNGTRKPQNIRHLSSAGRSVFIRFTPRRFMCGDCRTAFKESVSWIHPNLQMTNALFTEILLRLTENVSIRSIADQEYVTPCVVKDVLDLSAAGRPAELPVALCMHVSGDTRSFEDLRNRLLLICGPVHPASPSGGGSGSLRPPCGGED